MTPKAHPEDVSRCGDRGPTAFATTHWSLVAQAARGDTAEGRAALEALCRTYWYPLYGFARRGGAAPADAEDLTQGFLADLLARGAIAQADAQRGRFRTFLLSSFSHYRAHEWAKAGARKRGGGRVILPLEALEEAEVRLAGEPACGDTPERAFDRKWALRLLELSLAATRREYERTGKAELFEALQGTLAGDRCAAGYAGVGRRLGMTEGAVKVAALRLRQCFAGHFRAEVARTILDPADTDDEIRLLLAAVST